MEELHDWVGFELAHCRIGFRAGCHDATLPVEQSRFSKNAHWIPQVQDRLAVTAGNDKLHRAFGDDVQLLRHGSHGIYVLACTMCFAPRRGCERRELVSCRVSEKRRRHPTMV